MTVWRFSAPAKVNLSLRVVGRREDGYHLLQSVMTFFPAADGLDFIPCSSGLHVESLPPVTERLEKNLVWRAARLMQQRAGMKAFGMKIRLYKRLPVAAGLGGGSSDAATTLLALNHLWGLGLSSPELQTMALTLGADLPFFVGGQAALVEGIGEILTPIPDFPGFPLVLINPGIPLATREVFQAFSKRLTRPPEEGYLSRIQRTTDSVDFLENDLEPVSRALAPVIGIMTEALRQEGAKVALMSGSGPSVFGVFAALAEAEAAARRLVASHPFWRILVGMTENVHPFGRERALSAYSPEEVGVWQGHR